MSTLVMQATTTLRVSPGPRGRAGTGASAEDVWEAIIHGDHERLLALLQKVPCTSRSLIELVGSEGQTPLHLACDVVDGEECVRVLVSHGAKVDAEDSAQRSPLLVACEMQSLGSARLLMLEAGASLKARDENGMGAAHWFAKHGAAELLALALKRGAEVDGVNASGQSPLHIAIMHGHLACALVLLDAGASPSLLDQENRCAMHLAMQFSGGLGACSESTLLLLRLLQIDSSLVRAADADKRTPLHWACGKNALPCVRALIKSGADVDATDWAGRTPMHWAVLINAAEAASELLQHGADAFKPDRDQRTPLHWAADRASERCLKLLLTAMDRSDAIDAADWGGYTALHYAARRGAAGCVRLLVSNRASKCAVAMTGETPTDLTTCDLTKALLTETVGMKRQRSLSSANSLVLFHVLPDLARQFYSSWTTGDVSAHLAPSLRLDEHPTAELLQKSMLAYPSLQVDDVHVCSKTSKVVVELSTTNTPTAVKAMHAITFTDEGLVEGFVPYICAK